MKIIAPAALVAATLVLTAAVPALADGDPRPQTGHTAQKGSPAPTAHSGSTPTTIIVEEDQEGDFSEGILRRLVTRVL
jgi:hypothetical protein